MNIKQEELDWLAEGEMDASERAALFARLDESSDGWKRCAIALVEHQLIRGSIKEMVDSGFQSEANEIAVSDQAPQTFHEYSGKRESKRRKRISWLSYVAAAVLLIMISSGAAFFIGMDHGQQQAFNQTPVGTNEEGSLTTPDIDVSASPGQFEELVARTGVADATLIGIVRFQSDDQQESIVPILSSPSIEQHIEQEAVRPISQTVRNELRKEGWLINASRQFVSVQSPFGSHRIFPVDLLNYRFVGKQVF